jgi:hypothetical protein
VDDSARSHATPIWVYLLCAWPLVFATLLNPQSGWIIGGIAFAINLIAWRSPLPLAAKLPLNLLVGAGAILLNFV